MMKNLTGPQKALLAWSIVFLIAAEAAKLLPLTVRAAKLIGALELLLAIATGIAVGLAASYKKA